MKWLVPLALLGGAALLVAAYAGGAGSSAPATPSVDDPSADPALPDDQAPPSDDEQQTTSTLQDVIVSLSPSTYTSADVTPDAAAQNERAFRDMISFSEGTSGPDGYRTMFGGRLCDDLSDHPRQSFSFRNSKGETLTTTAAGRYQFLARTWDDLKAKLSLPDFGPDSQDAACMELIRQRGALNDVRAGRVAAAIAKCAPIWASLPGAGYNQPERKLSSLVAAYSAAGGTVNA